MKWCRTVFPYSNSCMVLCGIPCSPGYYMPCAFTLRHRSHTCSSRYPYIDDVHVTAQQVAGAFARLSQGRGRQDTHLTPLILFLSAPLPPVIVRTLTPRSGMFHRRRHKSHRQVKSGLIYFLGRRGRCWRWRWSWSRRFFGPTSLSCVCSLYFRLFPFCSPPV